ncbi:MAG: membrane protein [Bacteroidia bacterium]|nr:MAG: membrane protein [Bacteroidia bacterium]
MSRVIVLVCLGFSLLAAQEEREVRQPVRPSAQPSPAPAPSAYTLQGVVVEASSGEPLPGAYIKVKNTLMGTVSDASGRFRLSVLGSPPFRLEVSYVGYQTAQVEGYPGQEIRILLQEGGLSMQEVVISTSRVPEAILEAPVTVSRLGIRELRMGAAANIFQQLSTLKNVDVNYQSITFPVINTRGFGATGNPRFVQRIDGIEMLAPVFGFPVGLLCSPSEIDLESAELTAGPASALYGPNAFNGLLDMYTRQPRRYPGLAATIRVGVNHIASDTSVQPYLHFSGRYAHTFGDRLSLKLVAEYLRATDWMATDYRDEGVYTSAQGPYAVPGPQNPGYNGLNTYGDEVRIGPLNPAQIGLPFSENFYLARTPYRDRDIIDPAVFLQKYTAQAQYFLSDNLELSWRSFFVNGNTIYQATNRNALRDVVFHQHKLELRGKRFFVRAYGSWESSGRAYDSRFTGIFLNQWAKPNDAWFIGYFEGYSLYGDHARARVYADTATRLMSVPGTFRRRLEPSDPEFKKVMEEINSGYYRTQGQAGFYDRSSFYHAEAQYDLSDHVGRWVELLVGGNLRLFRVNTRGTLFVDYEGPFITHEYGSFIQANRWFFQRRLRVLASLRYDKNQYFTGRFTPRVALLYAFGKERQHSLRLSYQTGFRIPTLQDQFIALDIGFQEITLGGTLRARSAYGLDKFMFTPQSVSRYQAAAQGVTDSATLASLASQTLVALPVAPLKPEFVQYYEAGGRFQVLRGLYIDLEYARAYYQDFVLYRRVISSKPQYESGTTRPISLSNIDPATYQGLQNLRDGEYYAYNTATNLADQVYADFASVGVEYAITPKVLWTASYSYATLVLSVAKSPDLLPNFNTPAHKAGSSIFLSGFGRWGGSLNYRWIDAFQMDGLIRGPVPATQWVDAQVSYSLPRWKTQLRVGAQNLLNVKYRQIPGGPRVGGLYYFQVVYDPFLR